MLAPTHAIYGPAVALILLAVFGVEASFHWTIVLCAVLGSLAPDIDYPRSTLGRLVPWISKPIEQRFGHRAVTHSLIGTVVATIAFASILSITTFVLRQVLEQPVSIDLIPISLKFLYLTVTDILRLTAAFTIGYASHIALDMLTPRGVNLLWPSPNRDIWFKNSLQIETASKGEVPVALLGIVLLALAFPLSQYGPMTALRWFLATPEAVIAEYKNSPTATFVEFEGIWSTTKQPIKGTAEILDIQNKRLVVVLRSPQSQEATSSPLPIPANRSRDGLHLRGSHTAERNSTTFNLLSNDSNSMSDSTSSHLPDTAHSLSDSPPTRNQVVVTLSDELSADIISKKVRLIKTKSPIQIDKYQFKKQTREQLLKRIPDDVLISGKVYLPHNLKLQIESEPNPSNTSNRSAGIQKITSTRPETESPQTGLNWIAIEQVGNELRLHHATKQQLAQIGFDDSFFAAQKKSSQKSIQLKTRLSQLQSKRQKIEFPHDGLTPLGRKMMATAESTAQQQENLAQINQQIEVVQTQLEDLSALQKEAQLLFSGWVNIRLEGAK